MKTGTRLRALMKHIESGELSRNKHFDEYLLPEVKDAKARLQRIHQLWALFERGAHEAWQFRLRERPREGFWLLECRSLPLRASWMAVLNGVELEFLQGHPLGALFHRQQTQTPRAWFQIPDRAERYFS